MHTLETVLLLIGEKTSKCRGHERGLVEGCGDCSFCVNMPKFGGPGRKQILLCKVKV